MFSKFSGNKLEHKNNAHAKVDQNGKGAGNV